MSIFASGVTIWGRPEDIKKVPETQLIEQYKQGFFIPTLDDFKARKNYAHAVYPVNAQLNEAFCKDTVKEPQFERLLNYVTKQHRELSKPRNRKVFIYELVELNSKLDEQAWVYGHIVAFMQCTKAMAEGKLHIYDPEVNTKLDYKHPTKGLPLYTAEKPLAPEDSEKQLMCTMGKTNYLVDEKDFNKLRLWNLVSNFNGLDYETSSQAAAKIKANNAGANLPMTEDEFTQGIIFLNKTFNKNLERLKGLYGISKEMLNAIAR